MAFVLGDQLDEFIWDEEFDAAIGNLNEFTSWTKTLDDIAAFVLGDQLDVRGEELENIKLDAYSWRPKLAAFQTTRRHRRFMRGEECKTRRDSSWTTSRIDLYEDATIHKKCVVVAARSFWTKNSTSRFEIYTRRRIGRPDSRRRRHHRHAFPRAVIERARN